MSIQPPDAYIISRGSLVIVFSTMLTIYRNPCATVPRLSRYEISWFKFSRKHRVQTFNVSYLCHANQILRIWGASTSHCPSKSYQVSCPKFYVFSSGSQRSELPSVTLHCDRWWQSATWLAWQPLQQWYLKVTMAKPTTDKRKLPFWSTFPGRFNHYIHIFTPSVNLKRFNTMIRMCA